MREDHAAKEPEASREHGCDEGTGEGDRHEYCKEVWRQALMRVVPSDDVGGEGAS